MCIPSELLTWVTYLWNRALWRLPFPCLIFYFLFFDGDGSFRVALQPPSKNARYPSTLPTLHSRSMVLSGCLHQNLGPICMARPTVFHPVVLSRLLSYFAAKSIQFPPDGIILHSFMIIMSLFWGARLTGGVLWLLGRKFFDWLCFRWSSPPGPAIFARNYYRRFISTVWAKANLPAQVTMACLTKLVLSTEMTAPLLSYVSFEDRPPTTVVLDNSATGYICNERSAFIEYFPVPSDNAPEVVTVNGSTMASGIGTIEISWDDDDGVVHTYKIHGVLHIPDSPVNLLGIGQFARDNPDLHVSIQTFDYHSIFRWGSYQRSLPHPSSNLPELPIRFRGTHADNDRPFWSFMTQYGKAVQDVPVYPALRLDGEATLRFGNDRNSIQGRVSWADPLDSSSEQPSTVLELDDDVTSHTPVPPTLPAPVTLSEQQLRFLRWHERLNHLPMAQMLKLAESGRLPRSFVHLKSDLPPCGACLFGRQHRRPRKGKLARGSIRKPEHDHPGAAVSTDQLVSHQPGLVPQSAGKLTNLRITAATVFVDHFSDFVYVALMPDLSSESTLRAKQEFEAFCGQHDVTIRHYHADNGRFTDTAFREDLRIHSQSLSLCAVGHHAQNGIVEKKIGLLTETARTMLLHAERFWPEAISSILWPFALKLAAHIHNHCHVSNTGVSPVALFTSTPTAYESSLDIFHTFGSPCYVLDSRLQSGLGGVPKWEPRSSLRIYVGLSPLHSTNVAMVLNPYTGLVSPQYHVVFDDHFQTLDALRRDTVPEAWKRLCETACVCQPVDSALFRHVFDGADCAESEVLLPASGEPDTNDTSNSGGDGPRAIKDNFVNLRQSGLRRSQRSRAPNPKYSMATKLLGYALLAANIVASESRQFSPVTIFQASVNAYHRANLLVDSTINSLNPFAFTTLHENNEVFTFKEAMNQTDSSEFVKAMVKEVQDHEERSHWTLLPRSEMPKGKKTILSIWSFKRKRSPSGELLKHKARLCAHGGMQKWGDSYWETYSPTVNWLSVRALLAISLINDFATSTIDFTLAFPQVDLDVDVFMELPTGMVGPDGSRKGYILKLNKSLYGLKQASHNWFLYLCKALENRGYIQSSVDKCVFYKDDIVLLIYVDDILIIGKDNDKVDAFKDSMKAGSENFIFTDGESLDCYLGVQIERLSNGTIKLFQPYLIERIIRIVMEDKPLNPSKIPAAKELLHKDSDGPVRKHDFNYRQVVGMLSYLQGTTRPDISAATHACARFCNDPKLSHEKAIIKLLRYLVYTKDKGIILNPDISKGIECYVDASFAPGWRPEDPHEATNLLSRTGYVICYANCPVHWSSKMQTEIALSTAEAEYIALSQAMREVIPFIRLIVEINVVFETNTDKPIMYCKVHEDNEACISMVQSPKFTPRTKHIALKYHHFRSYVDKGLIQIAHIGTTEQTADIFTKPLEQNTFEYLRKKLSGW